jgi:hypothetical protein
LEGGHTRGISPEWGVNKPLKWERFHGRCAYIGVFTVAAQYAPGSAGCVDRRVAWGDHSLCCAASSPADTAGVPIVRARTDRPNYAVSNLTPLRAINYPACPPEPQFPIG